MILLFLSFASAKWMQIRNQRIDHFETVLPFGKSPMDLMFFQSIDLDFSYSSQVESPPRVIIYLYGTDELPSDGNISAIYPYSVQQIAKNTNSTLLAIEHRYFGNSLIKFDQATGMPKYLTTKQALADIAFIIDNVRREYKTDKCFIIGYGYSGLLAALFRLKYPREVDGAWAVSALIQRAGFDDDHDINVAKRLESTTTKCLNMTRDILDDINETFTGTDTEKKNKYKKILGMDKPYNISDQSVLYEVAEMFNLMISYTNESNDLVSNYCYDIQQKPTIEIFAKTFTNIVNTYGGGYQNFDLLNPNMTDKDKSELYVRCNEIGLFHVAPSSSSHSNFHFRSKLINSNFYENVCKTQINVESIGNIEIFEKEYGGKNFSGTSILFTQSINDLEHHLMVSQNIESREIYTIDIDSISIDAELREPNVNDSQSLLDVRSRAIKIVSEWIGTKFENTCNKHGHRILHHCKCDELWEGHDCSIHSMSLKRFRVLSAISTALPTIVMLIIGFAAWKTILADPTNEQNKPVIF